MNHKPFRDWLLSEDELSVEQQQALKDHLLDCEPCRQVETSWKELEVEIKRSPIMAPTAGFALRWQAHLSEHLERQQRLRGWISIGTTATLVVVLLIMIVIQVWSLIQAPDAFLAAWFERLVGVVSIFFSLQNLILSISLPGPVYTLAAIILFFGVISFMSVLWLATLRKFSMTRREA